MTLIYYCTVVFFMLSFFSIYRQ